MLYKTEYSLFLGRIGGEVQDLQEPEHLYLLNDIKSDPNIDNAVKNELFTFYDEDDYEWFSI